MINAVCLCGALTAFKKYRTINKLKHLFFDSNIVINHFAWNLFLNLHPIPYQTYFSDKKIER